MKLENKLKLSYFKIKFFICVQVTEEDTTPTEFGLSCEDVEGENSYACINITVTDVNDCSPVFSENPFLTGNN